VPPVEGGDFELSPPDGVGQFSVTWLSLMCLDWRADNSTEVHLLYDFERFDAVLETYVSILEEEGETPSASWEYWTRSLPVGDYGVRCSIVNNVTGAYAESVSVMCRFRTGRLWKGPLSGCLERVFSERRIFLWIV